MEHNEIKQDTKPNENIPPFTENYTNGVAGENTSGTVQPVFQDLSCEEQNLQTQLCLPNDYFSSEAIEDLHLMTTKSSHLAVGSGHPIDSGSEPTCNSHLITNQGDSSVETDIHVSYNIKEEPQDLSEQGPDEPKANVKMLLDDRSCEAAEVLASLPSLIPFSGHHRQMINESEETRKYLCLKSEEPYNHHNIYDPNHTSRQLEGMEGTSAPPIDGMMNYIPKPNLTEMTKSNYTSEPVDNEPPWCDVGIFRGTSCLVTSYFASPPSDPEHTNITTDNLPDFSNLIKLNLEPGTAYKFRICPINSCGRGPWSEVSAFRTSFPGFPGAPSSVSISRSVEGAHLSWQPPSNPAGSILEYSVCLAVKNPHKEHPAQKLTLMLVYTGPHTQTIVSNASLEEALIDTSSKPAIIFRITAKNEKGYGPPTQVRWLQDVPNSNKS